VSLADAPFELSPEVVAALQASLGVVAERTVEAIEIEVGEYRDQMTGAFRDTVQNAVPLALGGILRLAATGEAGTDAGTPIRPVLDAAYALGRGEARSGRTMSALLAAYRVGARIAWNDWSSTCVTLGVPAVTVARFAELMFSYIDALSAASVTGHSDELAVSGRVREQYRERLAIALQRGAPVETLLDLAQRAEWDPPTHLTAVVVRSRDARTLQSVFGPSSLLLVADLVGLADDSDLAVLLVPGAERRPTTDALRTTAAVLGPTTHWNEVAVSLRRAVAVAHRHGVRGGIVDSDDHLAELVLSADPESLEALRRRALAPLADLRPDVADRLAATLRSWLLHQGRREDVAADLHVHPQTVRYRMTQLRELYGADLADPDKVLALVVGLGLPR
jgi:hypothetical protein